MSSRRPTRAALLAAAPLSVRARNGQPFEKIETLPSRPVAPPAPAKRPGRGSARPVTPGALPGALDAAAGVVVVELPGLALPSLANMRGWRKKHAAVRAARVAVFDVVAVSADGKRKARGALAGVPVPPFPLLITITRTSPRLLDPTDNLPGSAKGVIDACAEWCGVDDGPSFATRVRYVVTQAKGPAAVRIAVGPMVTRRALCPSCGCAVDVGESEGMR